MNVYSMEAMTTMTRLKWTATVTIHCYTDKPGVEIRETREATAFTEESAVSEASRRAINAVQAARVRLQGRCA